jgi:hypothetical protein
MEFNFKGGLAPNVYVGRTKLGLHILPFFFQFNTSEDHSIRVDANYGGSISAKITLPINPYKIL